ncbi:micronuclear linker histone polyprotein-like [Palaemon carinicauda]|uniref:micronuclear linker histone polyprotein-like n=1 Tax=Palaemon carinicauda TaxID=392227 RepID=UPI0035B655D8
MASELKAIKDQLSALKNESESEISASESAVEVATDRTCYYLRSRPLPSSQDQGRRYVDGRKGVRGTYPQSAVASDSPVAFSQAALDRHGKGVSDVIVSSPNPSPRRKWQYEAMRPTKRKWNRNRTEPTRSRSPCSSSPEPCPSEDDLDAVPVKRPKPRDESQERPSRDPSLSTSATRQPSPSEMQDPAAVAKSFIPVMQKQLFSLVLAFSCPSPQSDRLMDNSVPVKKSASKRERSSFHREPWRASSKARYRASSSSTCLQDAGDSRHQDDSVSRSQRQDDSVSRSRRQDDSASRRQDDCSSRRNDASNSQRQDASAYRLKDSSSARQQDASGAWRQDARGSQCQDVYSPLLQDASYDLPLSDAGEPSARRETVGRGGTRS